MNEAKLFAQLNAVVIYHFIHVAQLCMPPNSSVTSYIRRQDVINGQLLFNSVE